MSYGEPIRTNTSIALQHVLQNSHTKFHRNTFCSFGNETHWVRNICDFTHFALRMDTNDFARLTIKRQQYIKSRFFMVISKTIIQNLHTQRDRHAHTHVQICTHTEKETIWECRIASPYDFLGNLSSLSPQRGSKITYHSSFKSSKIQ